MLHTCMYTVAFISIKMGSYIYFQQLLYSLHPNSWIYLNTIGIALTHSFWWQKIIPNSFIQSTIPLQRIFTLFLPPSLCKQSPVKHPRTSVLAYLHFQFHGLDLQRRIVQSRGSCILILIKSYSQIAFQENPSLSNSSVWTAYLPYPHQSRHYDSYYILDIQEDIN